MRFEKLVLMNRQSLEDHVLAIICSVFDAYSAVLFLPEEGSDTCYLAGSFSLGQNIPEKAAIIPGRGLAGWIVQQRKPIMVADFDHKKHSLGYYINGAEKDIKAFMGYPIPTGGAICVDSKRQYSFSTKDYKLLQLFADLVARQQNIGAAANLGDIPRYFAELGIIQDLRFRYKNWHEFLRNFLHTISDATQFDYCAFATRYENSSTYVIECESAPLLLPDNPGLELPVGSGITGWVFLNEQPVFAEEGGLAPGSGLFGKLPDIPDFPAAICIPVIVNHNCLCVLCLANTMPKRIDESMRNFVRQSVDYLSLFLENLYLKNRLHAYFPQASLKRDGAKIYNPDSAPYHSKPDDILE